ncbi:MAG: GNAT family N-acetyltransferase [Dethiobacteria bacterium]|nr:GNAT family N-acetyltransferase [Dethiobacteria bacterium]
MQFVENPKLDARVIAELRNSVGWDAERKRPEKLAGCTYMTAACFDDDKLVGFVDVLGDGLDDALIRGLVVHPAYQRQGIGLKLLQMVISQTKKDGIRTTNVLFDPGLSDFYRKAGFKIISGGIIENETEGF